LLPAPALADAFVTADYPSFKILKSYVFLSTTYLATLS